MTDRLKVILRVRNALVHYWGASGLVFSKKNRIYLLRDLSDFRPILLGKIPWRAFQNICHIRIADRMLKGSILQVQEAENQVLLVCNGSSWWSIRPGREAERIPSFSRTRPMNRSICTSASGQTYIGDYFANSGRQEPVRIYRSRDFRSFEVAWEFPPGDIRHIHALIADPEDHARIWVLTGDRDPECRILFTEDDFKSLHIFMAHGQQTRATDLIVQNGNLVWGMDSPHLTSYLLSVNKENSASLKKLMELPGPVYYMARNRAGAIYCGTTVEPGSGVKDNFGHIFGSRPDGAWEEIVHRRTDLIPQYGIFYFPRGVLPDNYVVFSQRALTPQEGQMTIARDLAWPSSS